VHVTPRLGRIKANAINRAEVMKLHREIGEEKPVTAKRAVQVFSGALAYAVRAGLLPERHPNTARGIAKFRVPGICRSLPG
jgi:hypothetical protein